MRERLLNLVGRLASLGVLPTDSDEERLRKGALILYAGLLTLAGLIWAAMYAALGLLRAAAFPTVYAAISVLNLWYFSKTRRYGFFRFVQLLLLLWLPFLLQHSLGGFTNSGAVMLWSFMTVIGALTFQGARQALRWLLAFLALSVVFGVLDTGLSRSAPPVRPQIAATFFVMNIGGVLTVIYLLMRYFVRQREEAQERSERLLLNVLPKPIADRLKRDPSAIADRYAEVTVLFADIVDFTKFSAGIPPQELVALLNEVFSEFDQVGERHGLEKIKTIGDAYVIVGGMPVPRQDHAEAVAEMALEMPDALARACAGRAIMSLQLRIGIHTGSVIAGVIGRTKFIYDLWGDTVNTASRMESHGLPGSIQVSHETYARLREGYEFHDRGLVPIKSKGEMATYLLVGRKASVTASRESPSISSMA